MTFEKILYSFKEAANYDAITLEMPVVCKLGQILQYNAEQNYFTLLLEDQFSVKALGFIYKDLADMLNNTRVKSRIPFNLSIVKGKCTKTGESKYLVEIYYAIIENDTYINANLLGSHAFCDLETYLRAYINVASNPNDNLLWGNIIHGYLSWIFSYPTITKFLVDNETLRRLVQTAIQKSIHENWGLIVALDADQQYLLNLFQTQYFDNEIKFLISELKKYSTIYHQFEFLCEKMLYSSFLGLQGKADRIVRGKNNNHMTIYETKTGMSSHSTTTFAFYQCLVYASILMEFYPHHIDNLIIEYPRHILTERLDIRTYNPQDIYHILKGRNEIWEIIIGKRPKGGPFGNCGKCGSRDACEFYCYRAYGTKYCISHIEKCKYYKYFEANESRKELFRRLNAYFSWFLTLLDHEFLTNLTIINEAHWSAETREAKGNCIANLNIKSFNNDAYICPKCHAIMLQYHKCSFCGLERKDVESKSQSIQLVQYLELTKFDGQKIENTRLRRGDFILITPQTYVPLTSESVTGNIVSISSTSLIVKLDTPSNIQQPLFSTKVFRVDLTTSNYMINLEKEGLDQLIRYGINPKYKNIEHLRDLLLFTIKPYIAQIDNNAISLPEKMAFDDFQRMAILNAVHCKDLFLIQGPPGTGKTTVIAEIVANVVSRFESKRKSTVNIKNERAPQSLKIRPVLITAFTNKAVDEIILKLHTLHPEIKVLRIGNVNSIENEIVRSKTLERICRTHVNYPNGDSDNIVDPMKVKMVLENADVIAATTTSAGNQILDQIAFDMVILDEAGQIVEPSAIIPLLKGNRFILVGDHKQLPPITAGGDFKVPNESQKYMEFLGFDLSKGLSLSIFERVLSHYHDISCFILLQYQYRMNKIICQFVSDIFYEGKLTPGFINGISVGDQTLHDFFVENHILESEMLSSSLFGQIFDPEIPMIFIDTSLLSKNANDSGSNVETQDMESCFNESEAIITAQIVEFFIQNIRKSKIPFENWPKIITALGIITGYRAQNQKIFQMLQDILQKIPNPLNSEELHNILHYISIDTVDRFQGQEREIIIFNFVDSNDAQNLRQLNQELRRLNVSISRAKKKIIFIGNSRTIAEISSTESPSSENAKHVHQKLIMYIRMHKGVILWQP